MGLTFKAKTKKADEIIHAAETLADRYKITLNSGEPTAYCMLDSNTFDKFYLPSIGAYIFRERDGVCLRVNTAAEARVLAEDISLAMVNYLNIAL